MPSADAVAALIRLKLSTLRGIGQPSASKGLDRRGFHMVFERILVPTDFSEHSDWAIAHALGLARAFGSRLELIHAYQTPGPYDVVLPADLTAAVRTAAESRLRAGLKHLQGEGVDAGMHLVEDSPPHAIATLATELDADCVVMGTRGLTGLKHVLLGSNAERTMRLAPCPVLTIGRPVPVRGPERPAKLLVPTDFSDTSLQGLEMARQLLAGREAAEITLLHVYEVPVAMRSYMDASREPGFGGLSTRLLEELEALAQPLRSDGVEVSVRLLEGHAAPTIVDLAIDEAADWIVMGSHGRTGLPHVALGSVAERVVRSAPCPTLTVKGAAPEQDGQGPKKLVS
jgi:nucleotide-binding universal stress UspA family protein